MNTSSEVKRMIWINEKKRRYPCTLSMNDYMKYIPRRDILKEMIKYIILCNNSPIGGEKIIKR